MNYKRIKEAREAELNAYANEHRLSRGVVVNIHKQLDIIEGMSDITPRTKEQEGRSQLIMEKLFPPAEE